MPGKGRRGSRAAAVAALCAACMAGASAQTIYRCGGDPRHLSDRPCAAGDRTIRVDVDRPNAERQREAAEVAAREARLSDRLRAERNEREAAAPAGPAGFATASAAAESGAAKHRPKKPKSHRLPAKAKKRVKPATDTAAPASLRSS